MRILLTLVFSFLFLMLAAQEERVSFPGGLQAQNNFILQNLKYPSKAGAFRGDTSIFVVLNIDTTGHAVLQYAPSPEEDIMGFWGSIQDLVDVMPRWIPATYKGHKIPSQAVLQLNFSRKSESANTEPYPMFRDYYLYYEHPPSFPYGQIHLSKRMAGYIRSSTGMMQLDAKVSARIVVDTQGEVSGIIILDKEGQLEEQYWKQAIAAAGSWKPAQIQGRPVKAQYLFQLHLRY